MGQVEVKEIVIERLSIWGALLVGRESTPLVLVGVGHNQNCGDINVWMCEGVKGYEIAAILRAAADRIEKI
jgi:hypothetical protein